MSNRYLVKTLGCKANFYDTQLLEQELQKRGWLPSTAGGAEGEVEEGFEAGAQLCIVNSCTVTNDADKQSRKMAARLSRENPNAIIVMTGCGAEVDPEGMKASPGIHFVVGNQNKNHLVDLVLEKVDALPSGSETTSEALGTVTGYGELISRHPHDREWPPATDSFFLPSLVGTEGVGSSLSHKTRCFLKIQEGCNSFCTYCIIPYGRGPSRSLPLGDVVTQVQNLVSAGVKEVVLTGTNIGDYGTDLGLGFALDLLIKRILDNTDLQRLRVSSLDPTEITPEILELMESNPRFCPHFHVSLQSPHSRILKLMKRKYGFEQVKECLTRIAQLKAPLGGPFVGMDLITGFPGETDQEAEWTYDALANLPWSRLHVFPYSERGGTPATRLPGSVHQEARVLRARRLNELSLSRLKSHYQAVLDRKEDLVLDGILMEKAGLHTWSAGYTPNYLRVLLPRSETLEVNQLVSAVPVELSIDTKSWDVGFIAKRI